MKKESKRQSYPLPQEYVVMLETLLGQALESNPPVKQGIQALSIRLGLQGPYSIRLKASFEPMPERENNPT